MKYLKSVALLVGVALVGLPQIQAVPTDFSAHSFEQDVNSTLWGGDDLVIGPHRRQSKPELRILPLGASTVFGVGSSDGNGFRKYLRDQARHAGYEVNMVGSKNGGTMKDNDNEGHSGYRVHQIEEESRNSFKFKPNVVVINAGTNDCIGYHDNGNQHNRLKNMIENLWRGIDNSVVVIVSTLLPLRGSGSDVVGMVNENYRRMVRELAAQGRPIYIADMSSITSGEVPDGIHPDDGGFKKMATQFWAGIRAAERDRLIMNPGRMSDDVKEGDNCRKEAGKGVYAGGLTQTGSGAHDDIYRHNSQDMGTILTITSDWDRNQWRFARLFRSDRDDLLGWFETNGKVMYGVWRNNGGGSFTKIQDLDVKDNCRIRGVHFIDVNADGLDDFVCIGPDGALYFSINKGNGHGTTPPEFVNLGRVKEADGYPQAQVRLGDMDGDGRADFIGLSTNGDARVWRNGWVDDRPAYWQPLGLRFTGKGMGDLRGTRFEDINGDGRDDWLWVSDTGATTTWTNARSCAKGRLGDGLNIAWRQGFNRNSNSGPTHMGNFGSNVRDRIHFARIYGEPQDFGLLGRQDYVFLDHREEGGKHKFMLKAFKNIGRGGTKLVADGNKYCDMTGNGRDDYVWAWSTGKMEMFPNAGKDFISGGESFWRAPQDIFDPRRYVGKDLDRRDLHLADWDGGGSWNWQYLADPASALWCSEKRGIGIDDLAVRFADFTGNGRADYVCLAKDGKFWGWTQGNNGQFTRINQFKSAKGHDRANIRFADVNGDGKDDTIWVDKFTGDGHVYYNKGRRDIGGSNFEWEQKSGGGPFHAYSGNAAGTCNFFPDLNGDGRADQHNILGTWTNEAKTWYNMCEGDRTGDDPNMGNPNLPDVSMPPSPGSGSGSPGLPGFPDGDIDPPDWAEDFPSGNPVTLDPPPLSDNCGFDVQRPFPNFFAPPNAVGSMGGRMKCIGKWNRGLFIDKIWSVNDEWMVRKLTFRYSDGSTQTLGNDDGGHKFWHREVEFKPLRDPWARFDTSAGGAAGGIGHVIWHNSAACVRQNLPADGCALDAGRWWGSDSPRFHEAHRGRRDEGMLLGFQGREGDGIDSLMPFFSDGRTEKVKLADFIFTPTIAQLNEKPFEDRTLQVVQDHWTHRNPGDEEAQGRYQMMFKYQSGTKFTSGSEVGWEFGAELGSNIDVEIEGRLPLPVLRHLFKVDGELKIDGKLTGKYTKKTIDSTEKNTIKDYAFIHTAVHKIPPRSTLYCTAVLLQSDVDLQYVSTLNHRFSSGKSYNYTIDGHLQSAAASDTYSECYTEKIEDDSNVRYKITTTRGGSYCPDGKRVGDGNMSDNDFAKACGVSGIGNYPEGINLI